MKTLLVAALSLFLHGAASADDKPQGLLIRNVTLIDGKGGPPQAHVDVFLQDGKVAAFALPAGAKPAQTIDASGLFMTPGLIDAHVHIGGDPWAEVSANLKKALQGGVTAVFDVAGDTRATGNLARAQLAGEIESPSVYYSALFAGPAFMADPRTGRAALGYASGTAPWMRAITADTDLQQAVAEVRGTGALAIKLYASLDQATIARIGQEAQRQHVRLIAHGATFPGKPSDLIKAGVKYLAHSPYLAWEGMPLSQDFKLRGKADFAAVPADGPVMTALLESMKANDVALNPTLWVFAEGPGKDDPSGLRTAWMNLFTRRAQAMGVTIAAGVDVMVLPDEALPMIHKELDVLVKGAGLTPMQAIMAATSGAAHSMGLDQVRGTVAPGMVGDLLLVSADPTADIRNLREIRYVIKDAKLVFSK